MWKRSGEAMAEQSIRRRERILKRRFFYFGVVLTLAAVIAALLLGALALVLDFDVRPYVALLPVFYAPILLAGVAWLAWMTAAPSRGR